MPSVETMYRIILEVKLGRAHALDTEDEQVFREQIRKKLRRSRRAVSWSNFHSIERSTQWIPSPIRIPMHWLRPVVV